MQQPTFQQMQQYTYQPMMQQQQVPMMQMRMQRFAGAAGMQISARNIEKYKFRG